MALGIVCYDKGYILPSLCGELIDGQMIQSMFKNGLQKNEPTKAWLSREQQTKTKWPDDGCLCLFIRPGVAGNPRGSGAIASRTGCATVNQGRCLLVS